MADVGLILLRALTVVARLALAAALVAVVVRYGTRMADTSRRAWGVVAAVFVVLAVDNLLLEAFSLLRWQGVGGDAIQATRREFYHATYLLHALLAAALPAALLGIYDGKERRLAPVVALAPALAGAGVAVALGALSQWEPLLASSRVLYFLAIVTFLAFWTAVLLGWTRRVDAYLAGFVAVETLFAVLAPVQEIFYQLVGPDRAREMWHLSQFLQFATAAAQLAVVLALLSVLASGRPVRVVRVPV